MHIFTKCTHHYLSVLMIHHIKQGIGVFNLVKGTDICESQLFGNVMDCSLPNKQCVFGMVFGENLQRTLCMDDLIRTHLEKRYAM